jgi:Ala-tRNA(Pro) deacylase
MPKKQSPAGFLNLHQIKFKEYQVTGAVFPPPQSFWDELNILRCKNLFFRDNHGKNHFLVIIDYYKSLDIKKLQEKVGRGSLTMASGWRLDKYLGLKPGFLSVFGILNDEEKHVKVVIDKELDQEKLLGFLPNTEGGSFIALEYCELIRFFNVSGHEWMELELR